MMVNCEFKLFVYICGLHFLHFLGHRQVHDGSVKLEIWQLQLISTGPKILDFGTIYVKSVVTKSFTVFNDLPQAILVPLFSSV